MSVRSILSSFGSLIKDTGLPNYFIRHNPIFYNRRSRISRLLLTSPGQAEREIDRLLMRTVKWAQDTEHGRGRGMDISQWPILSQTEVKGHPERFRRRSVVSLPAATGGSSGRPLRLWRSLECIAAEQATIDSHLADDGRRMLDQRVAVLRADYVKDPADQTPPFGVWRNRRRWLVLSNTHLSQTTLPWFLHAIKSFQPDILWVYPTTLSNFLRLVHEAGAELKIPTVLSSSEMMSESLFNDAQQTLSARIIDYYGHNERCCSAYSDRTRQYWFDPAYGHVELILDPEGEFNSAKTARIIATGYWNSAFPLVRYDTGDRALLDPSDSRSTLRLVADGKRPFLGIIGRSDDYIIGRDGARITGMNHIPIELEGVHQVQIIQESECLIRVLVLSRDKLSGRDRQKLEENARQLLPPYMDLKIEPATELTTLPNGKTPFIMRNLDEETYR